MPTNNLIAKLRDYLELDRQKQQSKHDKIRVVLKKLKKQQRALEDALKKAPTAKARKRIKHDLKVLYVQRKKGLKVWRAIRDEK